MLETCTPLLLQPTTPRWFFHPGPWRVPTSSSCLHNNLQLFPPLFPHAFNGRRGSDAVLIQPRAGFVRPRRAPDPRRGGGVGGLAPLRMTRQLSTRADLATRAAIFL